MIRILSGLFIGLVVVLDPLAARADGTANFAGKWAWSGGKESLDLTLRQQGAGLTGYHAAVGENGMRVDEADLSGEPSVTGEVRGAVATVKFHSGFPDSTGGGLATLTLRGKYLDWRITQSDGEHYLPSTARLKRVADAPGEAPPAPPLKAEIWLLPAETKDSRDLSIGARVQNVSPGVQQLQIPTCSFADNWVSDNPVVVIRPASCRANALENIALKPGESVEKKLSARVTDPEPKSVTFRLGFTRGLKGAPSQNPPPVFWSNAVTASVK